MDAFENMNTKTKIVLSFIGICAVLVPAGLLYFASGNVAQIPDVDSSKRQINQINEKSPEPVVPSPVIAQPSPSPIVPTPVPVVVPGSEATPATR